MRSKMRRRSETNTVTALARHQGLLRNLVFRDLRVKYKGSTLGFGWSLLGPLLMAAVYTMAFRFVLRVEIEHFPVFLLSGLLPWQFLSAALGGATSAITDNSTLVRRVAFPRVILPLSATCSPFVQLLLMFLVVIPVALVTGLPLSAAMVALVPLFVLQLLFAIGIGLMLATAQVHFRDTRHLLDVILQIWFWVTPVVYPLTLVPEALRRLIVLNPMAHFITAYQNIVLHQAWPSMSAMLLMTAAAVTALLAGLVIFTTHERRFAELV